MKKAETINEYFLTMKELANRGNVEKEALFHYVIDGILDDTNPKIIFYGASTVDEFKNKLKIYSEIKSGCDSNSSTFISQGNNKFEKKTRNDKIEQEKN